MKSGQKSWHFYSFFGFLCHLFLVSYEKNRGDFVENRRYKFYKWRRRVDIFTPYMKPLFVLKCHPPNPWPDPLNKKTTTTERKEKTVVKQLTRKSRRFFVLSEEREEDVASPLEKNWRNCISPHLLREIPWSFFLRLFSVLCTFSVRRLRQISSYYWLNRPPPPPPSS